ncbi:MAG: hypothetical protein KAT05_13965 [Spirochaetes bacterium]|nr:hypothetical protein [Spirochaetota bacterium]
MPNCRDGIHIDIKKSLKKKYNIYDREEFRQSITYECNRTNHSAIEFSLVIFFINKNITSKQIFKKFIKLLSERVRALDIIGSFDEKSLGIMLPSTSYDEAYKFVTKLNIDNNFKNIFLFYNIYNYPKIWYNDKIECVNNNNLINEKKVISKYISGLNKEQSRAYP